MLTLFNTDQHALHEVNNKRAGMRPLVTTTTIIIISMVSGPIQNESF
jgi:hypothetical protein